MKDQLLREITPLTRNDCFTILSRVKSGFDFPLHYHEEFELNFIQNAKAARRVIGDHMEDIEELELVLVGPNLQHGWFTHKCQSTEITEITIQFHRELLDDKFLHRNQMSYIRSMFEHSLRGILFSKETIQAIKPRLEQLPQKHGFESVLELLSILHDLSTSRNIRSLSDISFRKNETISYTSRRIDKVMEYLNNNFEKQVTLLEVAKLDQKQATLPEPVKATLKKMAATDYKGWKLLSSSYHKTIDYKKNNTYYEVTAAKGAERKLLTMTPDGKVVKMQ